MSDPIDLSQNDKYSEQRLSRDSHVKWLLLCLAACGPAFTVAVPGEASVPEASANVDGSKEVLAETSTTDGTTSMDVRSSLGGIDSSAMEASLLDTSEKPSSDAGSSDSASVDCNLTCEPMCRKLAVPQHACCSPHAQCHCTALEDAGACTP